MIFQECKKQIVLIQFFYRRIGPEPTTDRFTCVYYGKEDGAVPGSVLQMSPDLPFRPLGQFGANFLNKFEGSSCSSNALKSFMFVDSPGVLSGQKQINRQYPFKEVTEWFADRAARILILFDCNKLDISDEFKAVIKKLRKHDDKIRIVLNKSDSMAPKELIRVYGALMWSLGKVFDTPEVLKVYISSFHDKPFDKNNFLYSVFKGDGTELIAELKSLPRQQAMQKVNETLKRMRLVKLHSQIMAELKQDLPRWWGKKAKQKQIIENLPQQFQRIARKIGVPPADFPSLKHFKKVLAKEDLSKYPKPSQRKFKMLNYAMERTIPSLVKKLMDRNNDEAEVGDHYNPFSAAGETGSNDDDVSTVPSGEAMKDLDRKIDDINARGSYYEETVYENASVRNRSSRMAPNRRPASVNSRQQYSVPRSVGSRRAPEVLGSPSQNPEYERLRHLNGGNGGVRPVSYNPEDDQSNYYDYNPGPGSVSPSGGMPRRDSTVATDWVVGNTEKVESDNIYYRQQLSNGKLTGIAAKKAFAILNLPENVLNKIWVLCDFEKKNALDADQFALALWLGKQYSNGVPLPIQLTWQMIPPSYR